VKRGTSQLPFNGVEEIKDVAGKMQDLMEDMLPIIKGA